MVFGANQARLYSELVWVGSAVVGRTLNEQRLSGTEVVIVDCLIFSTINERAGELALSIEVAFCCEGKAEARLSLSLLYAIMQCYF